MNIKGEIVQGCGENRYLIFQFGLKKQISDVWQHCGKFGFTPIKIREYDELYCVNSLFKKIVANKNGYPKAAHFNVHGYDPLLDGDYWICGANKTVPEELWVPNEPNNVANMENFIAVTLSTDDREIGFSDVSSYFTLSILCEIEAK